MISEKVVKLRAQLRLPSGLIERANSGKPKAAPAKRPAKKAAPRKAKQ